tara:strand:+ start:1780 stop:2349 length:570 start_codon:yes stop_codon:yes gene_type:complete
MTLKTAGWLKFPKNPLNEAIIYFNEKDIPSNENMKRYRKLNEDQIFFKSSSNRSNFHLAYQSISPNNKRKIIGLFLFPNKAVKYIKSTEIPFAETSIRPVTNPLYKQNPKSKPSRKRKRIFSVDRDFDRRYSNHHYYEGNKNYWLNGQYKDPKTGEIENVLVSPYFDPKFFPGKINSNHSFKSGKYKYY